MKITAKKIDTVVFDARKLDVMKKIIQCTEEMFPQAVIFSIIPDARETLFGDAAPAGGMIDFLPNSDAGFITGLLVRPACYAGNKVILLHAITDWRVKNTWVLHSSDDLYEGVTELMKEVIDYGV